MILNCNYRISKRILTIDEIKHTQKTNKARKESGARILAKLIRNITLAVFSHEHLHALGKVQFGIAPFFRTVRRRKSP